MACSLYEKGLPTATAETLLRLITFAPTRGSPRPPNAINFDPDSSLALSKSISNLSNEPSFNQSEISSSEIKLSSRRRTISLLTSFDFLVT